jgi:hypothetical protein
VVKNKVPYEPQNVNEQVLWEVVCLGTSIFASVDHRIKGERM